MIPPRIIVFFAVRSITDAKKITNAMLYRSEVTIENKNSRLVLLK